MLARLLLWAASILPTTTAEAKAEQLLMALPFRQPWWQGARPGPLKLRPTGLAVICNTASPHLCQ
jgi:hypothetical protein